LLGQRIIAAVNCLGGSHGLLQLLHGHLLGG